jgi:hypothetical protein
MKRRPLPCEASSVLSLSRRDRLRTASTESRRVPLLSVPSVLWPYGRVKEDNQHVHAFIRVTSMKSSVVYAVGGRAGRQLRHVFGSAVSVAYCGRPVGR